MNIPSESAMLTFGQNLGENLAAEFRAQSRKNAVLELIGDVGAGKTTFTRGLALGLGISEPVTSPSFTISKRYAFKNGELVHYDFYRLDDPGIMRAELAESLETPNSVVVIEWGGDVASLLPENHLRLEFQLLENGARELTITGVPAQTLTAIATKINQGTK